MAHHDQALFLSSVANRFPWLFTDVDALDVGSLDINGNNRYLFKGKSTYTGIDIGPGPNVDVVCSGHLYSPGKQFGVVVSSECFEHDKYWAETMRNCVNLTKPGGIFLFTCAYYGRPEHGTTRTEPSAAPHVAAQFGDYYRNLGPKEICKAINLGQEFRWFEVIAGANRNKDDLYFFGIKYDKELSNETV